MTVAKKPNLILAHKEGAQFSVGALGTDPTRLDHQARSSHWPTLTMRSAPLGNVDRGGGF
jgi:hypothetical protein